MWPEILNRMIINICEVVAGDRDGKYRVFVIQFIRRLNWFILILVYQWKLKMVVQQINVWKNNMRISYCTSHSFSYGRSLDILSKLKQKNACVLSYYFVLCFLKYFFLVCLCCFLCLSLSLYLSSFFVVLKKKYCVHQDIVCVLS